MPGKRFVQHIGDDQLIHGLPKRMYAEVALSAKPRTQGTRQGNPASGEAPRQRQGMGSLIETIKEFFTWAEDPGSGQATDSGATFWMFHPKQGACKKCQALEGIYFEKKPDRPHPNCKCELKEYKGYILHGRIDIIVPSDVDIADNIEDFRNAKKACEEYGEKIEKIIVFLSFGNVAVRNLQKINWIFLMKCFWIYKNFKSAAKYDYKSRHYQDTRGLYEAFGNYNYGLMIKEMGVNITFAEAAAGAYQIKQGTSNISYWDTYFDDPKDNRNIRKGYDRGGW
jgi:hypothetical protein